MLQQVGKSASLEEVTHNFKVGDYLIYNKQGLCVLRGYREIEISGVKSLSYVIHKVSDLNTTIMVPETQWRKADISSPPSLKKIQSIIEILSSKPKQLSGMWKHREEKLLNLLNTSDAEDTANVVHLIYSKNRGKKISAKSALTAPLDDVEISYSERIILTDAVDALVQYLSFRCGLTKSAAANLVYRSVLSPSFAKDVKIEDTTNGRTGYTPKEFERAFGEKIAQAGKLRENSSIAVVLPEAPLRQAYYENVSYTPTPKPARSTPARAIPVRTGRTTLQRANDNSLKDSRRAIVLPQNKSMYQKILKELPTTQNNKVVLNLAARSLVDPEDIKIVGKLWLVSRANKTTHKQMQEELGLDNEVYQERLESIVSKLKTVAKDENIRAFDKVKFHRNDKNTRASNGKKLLVLEHNQEIYNELKPQLSKTPHFISVFNLAARTLTVSDDFKLAAKVWLVGRQHRASHGDMREELVFGNEEYKQHLKGVANTLRSKAQEAGLKAIDKVNFSLDDTKKAKTTSKAPSEIQPEDVSVSEEDGVYSVVLSFSKEDMDAVGGINLSIKFDAESGAALLKGKAINKQGERKRFESFEIKSVFE